MTTPRLLVVDDSEMNLELATHVLDGEGFEVQVANSAVEALQRVAVFRPDAIVMDIQMPGMDGLALSRLLKDAPETRHIVIIAFTAYAMKGRRGKDARGRLRWLPGQAH